jgi:hypothetical protein
MAATYFVRSRGRVTGPFDVAALQKMVRRGAISRLHELSEDRQAWAAAGEFDDLFPPHPADRGARLQVQVPGAERPDTPPSGTAPGAPQGQPQGQLFYSQAGAVVGPVSMRALLALAQNGTLRATDHVWQENADVAVHACQLTPLAPVFSALGEAYPNAAGLLVRRSGTNEPAPDPDKVSLEARRVAGVVMSSGLTAGSLSLLALNLPLVVVGHRVYWWWDGLGNAGSGGYALFCFFVLFGALTLCAVAALARGVARAIVYVAIPAVGFLLLGFGALSAGSPGVVIVSMLTAFGVPALALIVASCSRALALSTRVAGVTRPSSSARACLITFGAGLVVAVLTVLVCILAGNQNISNAPSWAVMAFALMVLSLITALVSGGIAVAGASPSFSPGLNRAVAVLACSSVAVMALSLLMTSAGVSLTYANGLDLLDWGTNRNAPSPGLVFFLLARVVVVFACLLAALAAGMYELLLAPFFARAARGNGHASAGFPLGAVGAPHGVEAPEYASR